MGWKNAVCIAAAAVLIAGNLSGCRNTSEDTACRYEEFITVDVFSSQANYQGLQSGWFAKLVKDKFNMELNIIAPNVAGGGDTLFQTRFAAGDVGDLIITGAQNGRLQNLVRAGLVLDMTEFLEDAANVKRYERALANTAGLVQEDGIYAVPSEVSSNSPLMPSEGIEPNYGVYIRWDIYKEIGYPKVETLEDLLLVLKQMQEAMPYSDSGAETYAISLFSDWDDNKMTLAKPEASLYGYDEIGYVLAKADGSAYESMIDSDSSYIRALRFLFEANQMGLVDPQSSTQNYDTLFKKYQDGQILFSPYSWLGQSAYNTEAHKADGKGFMLLPVEDQTIFSYGCQINGNAQNQCIMIGSKAEDPQRLADFIDWLYSPEGVISCEIGPEGLTWENREGELYLTELGCEIVSGENAAIPSEWGGGTYESGVSALNFKAANRLEYDQNTGESCFYSLWNSQRRKDCSALELDWQNYMNADTSIEYLTEHDQIMVAPGSGYVAPKENTELAAIRRQCSSYIVDYSWKMVFAEDQEAFEKLLSEMQGMVLGLGYEQVLEYDMTCALEQNEARLAVIETYEMQQH